MPAIVTFEQPVGQPRMPRPGDILIGKITGMHYYYTVDGGKEPTLFCFETGRTSVPSDLACYEVAPSGYQVQVSQL